MMKTVLFIVTFLISVISSVNAKEKTTVYLLPGQGSDCRIFSKLNFDSTQYRVICLSYEAPQSNESMREFSIRISKAIDTTQNFILVGVSLGGMISTEIAHHLNPEKVIIISSAKTKNDLPRRYSIQKLLGIYKWIPGTWLKAGALLLQPIVEPDRKRQKKTFTAMLRSKSPNYFQETVRIIINWNRTAITADTIYHIHGDKDNTIPLRNTDADYIVTGGSHMMTLTESFVIQTVVNRILEAS